MGRAFGAKVVIYTSTFTKQNIATDGTGLLAAQRKSFGKDFPELSEFPVPDCVATDGEQLDIAGEKAAFT